MPKPHKGPFGIIGSLQLSCTLLLCLFFLTAFGTIYQLEHNIVDTKKIFFNSWFLTRGGIPYFPGGMLCMSALMVNMAVGGLYGLGLNVRRVVSVLLHVALILMVAKLTGGYKSAGLSPLMACLTVLGGLVGLHLLGFGIKTKRQSVAIVHMGIAILLGSGMVKIMTSVEGHLMLYEGEQGSQYVSLRNWEIAIWEEGGANEIIIPDNMISDLGRDDTRSISSDELPFELEIAGFLDNCDVNRPAAWAPNEFSSSGFVMVERPNNRVDSVNNTAGLYARVGDQKAILWGHEYRKAEVAPGNKWPWIREPWTVHVEGRTFLIDFRRARYQMPFEILLKDAVRSNHGGMGMAMAYHSDVEKIEDGMSTSVRIQMNQPLRSGNLVLFQSGLNETPNGTNSIFTVVENVSDKWPEYSLWVVTLGMAMAFGRMLFQHVNKQIENRNRPDGGGA